MFEKVCAIPFEYLIPVLNFLLNFTLKREPFCNDFLRMLFSFRSNIALSHINLKTDNLFPYQCLEKIATIYIKV